MDDVRVKNMLIYLYKDAVGDIVSTLDTLAGSKLSLITSVVNPNFGRDATSDKHIRFTRSELLLDPNKWESLIAKLSDPRNCDSPVDTLRLRAEATLKQELDFAQHLVSRGRILMQIHGTNTSNLARFIESELTGECMSAVPVNWVSVGLTILCHISQNAACWWRCQSAIPSNRRAAT